MMTSSNGNIFRVTGPLCGEFTGPGEFPTQRPVTRSFDVYFDLRLNKRLSKQPWGWWFETLSWSLWRQCNVIWSFCILVVSLLWRHNGRDSVSNHQPRDFLLNRLFRRRSKKISKLRVTGLCVENSPGTGEFLAQMASKADNVSIWWRHYAGDRSCCFNDSLHFSQITDRWTAIVPILNVYFAQLCLDGGVQWTESMSIRLGHLTHDW